MRAREPITLVTGFPAFTARRLVRHLAALHDRVAILCQPKFADAAKEFVAMVTARSPGAAVEVLQGDVLNLDLGLSGRELKRLARDVARVHHVASVYYLGATGGLIERVNVDGTRNVLDLAVDFQSLDRLVLYSTAFVAGDRTGVIMEDDLEAGQRFRNAYERTKHEAERLARARMKDLPISVVRPSVIVGDSRTGEIDRLDGPYQLIRTIVNFPVDVHLPLPGDGSYPLNMVPVDFVAAAADAIARAPGARGRTFHLTDPNPLSARRVFEVVADVAGRKRPKGAIPRGVYPYLFRLPWIGERMMPQRHFIECFDKLTIFNCMNALEVLQPAGVSCPPFPSYASAVVKFVRARAAAAAAGRTAARTDAQEEEDPFY
jgi:nucleoside-diphosphate-sugar epimerase